MSQKRRRGEETKETKERPVEEARRAAEEEVKSEAEVLAADVVRVEPGEAEAEEARRVEFMDHYYAQNEHPEPYEEGEGERWMEWGEEVEESQQEEEEMWVAR
eukprot:16113517-Heterocapsa_arctica.AAC.1